MIALIFLAALGSVHFPSSVTGCTVSSSQIKAFYGPGDGLWRIRLGWSSDNPDCKVHLLEQVDGKDKFEIVESNECTKGRYCYFKASKQCCSNGKMQYKSMKFTTECSCHFATFTFTIKSLLSGSSSRYCESIISPGTTRRVKVDNMEFRECGKPCHIVNISRECSAVGCYCKDGYMLSTTTGKCFKSVCPPPPPDNPTKCLTLVTPECVKWDKDEFLLISWNAEPSWEYIYMIINSSGTIVQRETVQSGSQKFKVTSNNGELTIPVVVLRPDNYTIKVVAITSSNNCSGNGSFSIKKGCKSPLSLHIDSKGICLERFSYLLISWKVENDRTYKYSVSKEGTVVKEATVPGSGSDAFPVDNGRGQLRFKLDPGDYTVTVQDLDAGVNDYYNESKDFALIACNFEIETSNCVEKGQKVTVSLLAFPDRTYEFSVLVENTGQAVLNGSFPSGVNQNGVKATYDLDSSDSLPVGRYGVLIREVETGGEGYGNFDINSYGKIGADVKYRANPSPDGLYVCLHPREGRVFASGLTYKVDDGIESSLHGHGMCLKEAYGGGQGTLEITIKKDGEMAGRVDIDYVG